MFDKPVLNVGYNPPGFDGVTVDYIRYYDYDHYRPVVESGAVELARSEAELDGLIRQALLDPTRRRSERRELLRRIFGDTLDGRSGDRVAEVLLKLANPRAAATGAAPA